MNSSLVHVRPATPADAPAIARIYNEGIRGRMATFETTERSAEDIAAWFGSPHPLLVAERGAPNTPEIVGWIHASTYRERACYSGIAEFSVYVGEQWQGQRIGHALVAAFLAACMEAGYWKVLSRIFVDNVASRALCARHGFREVGVYQKHAKLDGVWRDVVIDERLLKEVGAGGRE